VQEQDSTDSYNEKFYAMMDPLPKHGTVIYQYGVLAWWAPISAAILGKELYIMDAMAITGWIPDIVVCGCIVMALGPAIGNSYHSARLDQENKHLKAFQIREALLNVELSEITALEAQPAALEEYIGEYKEALELQRQAEHRTAEMVHYTQTVDKLELLLKKSQAAATIAGNVDLELVDEHFLTALTDKKTHKESVDEAIAILGTDAAYGKTVQSVFDKYYNSDQFLKDRAARIAALENA